MNAGLKVRIRRRANEMWERESRPDGCAERHWLEAERELAEGAKSAAARVLPAKRAGLELSRDADKSTGPCEAPTILVNGRPLLGVVVAGTLEGALRPRQGFPPDPQEPASAEAAGPRPKPEHRPVPPVDWLLREGRSAATTRDLLEGLCRRLTATGLPLWRATYHQGTLHPQIGTTTYCWRRGQGGVSVSHRPHGCQETPQYLNSPVAAVIGGKETVRRRLEHGAAEPGFPVLEGLRAEGATDYAAMPVAFSDGLVTVATWASDRPGGFTAAELQRLEALLPALGAVIEARVVRQLATTVLDTYVGHTAGERILRGEIRRGDGATFHAALWYCDLRGFTALSEALPRKELVALLDEYFERVTMPVAAHGGEVLKFIGDSVLAAFPSTDGLSYRTACRSALAAAGGALAGMAGLNRERTAAGKPALGVGLALHVGEVVYGNVGTPERLDFTVIGPAVNLTYRLEKLCRPLGRTLLLSQDFARGCGGPLLSLGHHRIYGLTEPQEVFTLSPVGSTGKRLDDTCEEEEGAPTRSG